MYVSRVIVSARVVMPTYAYVRRSFVESLAQSKRSKGIHGREYRRSLHTMCVCPPTSIHHIGNTFTCMLTFLRLLEPHGQLSLQELDLLVLVLIGLDEPSVVLSSFAHSTERKGAEEAMVVISLHAVTATAASHSSWSTLGLALEVGT